MSYRRGVMAVGKVGAVLFSLLVGCSSVDKAGHTSDAGAPGGRDASTTIVNASTGGVTAVATGGNLAVTGGAPHGSGATNASATGSSGAGGANATGAMSGSGGTSAAGGTNAAGASSGGTGGMPACSATCPPDAILACGPHQHMVWRSDKCCPDFVDCTGTCPPLDCGPDGTPNEPVCDCCPTTCSYSVIHGEGGLACPAGVLLSCDPIVPSGVNPAGCPVLWGEIVYQVCLGESPGKIARCGGFDTVIQSNPDGSATRWFFGKDTSLIAKDRLSASGDVSNCEAYRQDFVPAGPDCTPQQVMCP